MQGRISVIQNGKRKMSRAFLGAHEELNFLVGVDDNVKTLLAPISDSSMKGLPLPGGSSSYWMAGEQLWRSTAAPPVAELNRKTRWKDQQELARPAVLFSLCRSAWQHRFERRHHCQAHLTV